jgi:SAM-dependent methyltransferase
VTSRPAGESWASGRAYEPFIGRWSRLVAREFLGWLGRPVGQRWVEVGCGTGALTHTLIAMTRPAVVLAADRSAQYVAYARAHESAGAARFLVADATHLPVRRAEADAVVSGLLLNFLPVPSAGVVEMARVARVGGIVAAYVWDYADRMELLRYFWDAAVEIDPGAAPVDEGRRFPLCAPRALAQVWQDAGLAEVETSALEVATPFRDFEEYWRPFLGGQGPAPAYVATLDGERREALRTHLRARVPAGPDGRIHLTARAWAVRGRRAA